MKPRSQSLDPAAIPLDGIHLIEASAGTGKTYAITSLYLRLILEGCRVDEILVVTFTEAATAELKARIRQRLYDALSLLDPGGGEAELPGPCSTSPAAARTARERLRSALAGFDENAIFTIHAFCLQTLKENAFESGAAFDTELVTECRPLYEEIANDFWAQQVFPATPLFASHLIAHHVLPADFSRLLAAAAPQPERRVLPAAGADVDADGAFTRAYAAARKALSGREAEIRRLIKTHPAVNRRSYTEKNTAAWLANVAGFLAPPAPRRVFKASEPVGEHIYRFTPARFASTAQKGLAPPRDPFFDACEELCRAARLFEQKLIALKRRFIDEALLELSRRKADNGIQFFDDLIHQVARALKGKEGERLTRSIRARFPVALIDEFQDTDQLQYDIFRRIYHSPALAPPRFFMIGDPKQSIYAFRNADVFAYLQAAADAQDQVYTLGVNWRSDPALIQAVNTLFGRMDAPFLFKDIPYAPVSPRPGARNGFRIDGHEAPPFRLLFVRPEEGRPTRDRIPALVAQEVADLLARQPTLSEEGGEKRLSPGHIAVLTRTNRQAEAVKEALLALRIPSVLASKESVFQSREASELVRFLEAVNHPGDEGRLKAVLAGDLFGLSAAEIWRLGSDDDAWEAWLSRFRHWHVQWEKAGFIQMIQEVWAHPLGEKPLLARILSLPDGERRVTNLEHLVELAHGAARRHHLKMAGLLGWLRQQQAETPGGAAEASELRLESDEDAVKLLTIHKSKGLEFPAVFCPYLWEGLGFAATAPEVVFHDPETREPVLDLGSEKLADHRRLAQEEDMAENLRLAYVALTRARHFCHVIWTPSQHAGFSPLGYLLHAPEGGSDPWEADRAIQALDPDAMLSALNHLAAGSRGTIAVSDAPAGPEASYAPATTDRRRLICHAPRTPGRCWQVTSYSALISPSPSADPFQPEGRDRDPEPDACLCPAGRHPAAPAPGEPVRLPEAFRGEKAGSVIHAILEALDFSDARLESLAEPTARHLAAFGMNAATWTEPVCQTLASVLATPLDPSRPGLSLGRLACEDRLCELEFHLPLGHHGQWHKEGVRWRELIRAVAAHGPDTIPGHYPDALARLEIPPMKGFLKGYIDLIFVFQGRFFIVDYKTNYLGDGLKDYDPARLEQQMARHHYYLQALIYAVALHRYLACRLDGYTYDTHFGGVYYLFVRGMSPAAGPGWGVWAGRPARELILSLSSLFQGNPQGADR